ncbi:hypothetical protein AXG93_3984s1000 [Marchantia polymorpha subsp. ruderalis]|uniref:Integrase catalytic domain-containing protein n=1 Tax=Marchantia polymorpha subsp. ruderalis TaxID=1480154 RepID=A0A176W3S8_MARPO|nr:hypothetical protein AXG93_3984s1000 [Marchantia polymorpha subsp. ruderalis]
MTSTSKVDIEKFDGSNDFELWKVKMLAHLGNMGLRKALDGSDKLLLTWDVTKKEEVLERAFNTLILSLGDKVLREHKDEAFGKFKEWKKMVEVQTVRNIKKLRTDNDLEYLGDEFNRFIKKEGMVRHKIVRGTPQQNRLAERMNQTLLERVRCMLFEAGLPKRYWREAISTATYLINRCPSVALNCKTPEEVWNGSPTKFNNLMVFGCVAYMHQREDKLDPRAKKCMFVGYPTGVKGWKLWYKEDEALKYVIRRDFFFRESEYYMAVTTQEAKDRAEVAKERFKIEVELLGRCSDEREHKDEVDENHLEEIEELSDESQNKCLNSYQLARNRHRRETRAPKRYGNSNLVAFALVAAEELEDLEPRSNREAMMSKDKELWKCEMKEEMTSLDKN